MKNKSWLNNKRSFIGITLTAATATLAACAPSGGGEPAAQEVAKTSVGTVGCTSFKDDFFNSLYSAVQTDGALPDPALVAKSIDESLSKSPRAQLLTDAERSDLRNQILELYRLAAIEAPQAQNADDDGDERSLATNRSPENSLMKAVAELEMGDRTSPAKAALQDRISEIFGAVDAKADSLGMTSSCPAPAEATPPTNTDTEAAKNDTLATQWKREKAPPVYGAFLSVSTAYQSCSAGPSKPLTSSTPNVQGISIVGTHSSGIGKTRVVSDVKALLATHPYLHNWSAPAAKTCFRVDQSPLIYDYGGKPYTDASTDAPLNFFRNGGSGSSALGIDCSAFVYSSYAAAGLKLKSSGRLKATGVHGVSSSMLADPGGNGLDCLDHVKFSKSQSIQDGDIIAIRGHVIMVDSVGKDPFGIDGFKKDSDCKLSNISASRFNFTIVQSSPSKGGIGINRMPASYYLTDGSTMGLGMRQHAVNACHAKFNGLTTSRNSSASLVRHLGTSACLDRGVPLANADCLDACPLATP